VFSEPYAIGFGEHETTKAGDAFEIATVADPAETVLLVSPEYAALTV
jgi:hypothetical protein